MKKFFVVLFLFFASSCEEDQIKDWTDDPQYDPKPDSSLNI